MGASNHVSVKAEEEVNASQTRLAREAIESAPETKRRQLEEAYRARGLTEEETEAVVNRLAKRPEEFLKAIVSEQHGIEGASFESLTRLAAYTGFAFALAGLLPILLFIFLSALPGVLAPVAVTAIGLFFAGILRALSTLNPFLRSGLEMVLVGMGAATATYLVGLAVGGVVA